MNESLQILNLFQMYFYKEKIGKKERKEKKKNKEKQKKKGKKKGKIKVGFAIHYSF